jgi:hypothetical protein
MAVKTGFVRAGLHLNGIIGVLPMGYFLLSFLKFWKYRQSAGIDFFSD